MKIKIFITGGTIDCEQILENRKYVFSDTHIQQMLDQARCVVDTEVEILMLKDSIFMNDIDRQKILRSCEECNENKIIIMHGTDTMTKTAYILGKRIKNKTIILFGAFVPFVCEESDALFNIGCAISAVQILDAGVYIVMNGKIFEWDKVKKNKKQLVFEENHDIDEPCYEKVRKHVVDSVYSFCGL